MAQKKRKKTTRCTANGVPFAAKLARDRMLREAVQQAAHDATVQVESDIRTQRALAVGCIDCRCLWIWSGAHQKILCRASG